MFIPNANIHIHIYIIYTSVKKWLLLMKQWASNSCILIQFIFYNMKVSTKAGSDIRLCLNLKLHTAEW